MRVKQKIQNYGVVNVEVIEGSAEKIPFEYATFDLIVSNLGINNFSNPVQVVKECNRILKPCGKLALTTNLNGHWREFYQVFEATAQQLQKAELIEKLKIVQEHRGTVGTISKLFTDNGFTVNRYFEEFFEMKFLNGSAFLNHSFVKRGWLESWKTLIPQSEQVELFAQLEQNLNAYAEIHGGLTLTVTMAYIEGIKLS